MHCKLCSWCLFFLSSLPAERLKVLACLNKLRQQHVDVMKVAPAPSREGTTSRASLVLSSCLSPCLSASPPFGLVVPAGAVVVPFLCRAANSEPFSIVGGLWKTTLTRKIVKIISHEIYVGTWLLWEIEWADERFEMCWEASTLSASLCVEPPLGFFISLAPGLG